MNDEFDPVQNTSKTADFSVGVRVSQSLIGSGWDEEDVCAQLGVSVEEWRAWCSGEQRVRASQLIELARITGKPVAWFFLR
jgi:transcriptional regulator with XRE-family HTH domain